MTAPGLVELQDDLSDALHARVRISMGSRRGKLQVEFVSVDDLERIVGVIARGLEDGSVAVPAGASSSETDRPDPAADGASESDVPPSPTGSADQAGTEDEPTGTDDADEDENQGPDADGDGPGDIADLEEIDDDDLEALTRPD